MSDPLAAASCARLPADALARLSRLRAREDVRVLIEPSALWVFWHAGDCELARWLLALPGAELLARSADHWHMLHCHLPTFDVPPSERARPLAGQLFPAAVEPTPPGPPAWAPTRIILVPDSIPKPTTALRLSLAALADWAELATMHALDGLLAAHLVQDQATMQASGEREPPERDAATRGVSSRGTNVPRSPAMPLVAALGDMVLLCGRLPPLVGERYWGRRVLIPAGWRPEPALHEEVLATALRLGEDDVAVVSEGEVDVFPRDVFGPVTRAGVRLALAGGTHAR